MQTFARDGLVFDVTDTGPADGEVVVLLHGFPQNRHEWDGLIPFLTEAGYRVLAPDQRGYSPGARPRGRKAYVTSELVSDVLALLDAAGVEQAHVVGHDWGAQVAWALASKHPERVRSLVPISVPHPQAFVAAMRHGQLLRSWYMIVFQLPVLPERMLSTGPVLKLLAGGLTPERMGEYIAPLGGDGRTGAVNWYRAIPLSQREKGYGRRITVPTTFVWSDGDVALGRYGAEATAQYVTGPYRFEVLSGLSHWIVDEAPEQLAPIVLARLRGEQV